MEQYQFNLIRENFYSIEMGFVRSFLVVGAKEMVLIDTGVGGNKLARQIQQFINLPVKVVFTHGDSDHVGDSKDFPIRFMHPSEFDYYQAKNVNPVAMQPIWEGDLIEIGAYRFEVLHLPGHTPGSIALLERDKRFLIGGDSIQKVPIFMFGPGRNFEALIASMAKLEKMANCFDIVYASHHDLSYPASIVTKIKEAAQIMVEAKPEGEPQERFDNQASLYQIGSISFFAK